MNNNFDSVVLAINYFIMKTIKEGNLPSARKLDKEKNLDLSVGWGSVAKFLKEHLYIYSSNNKGGCWNTSKKKLYL